MITVINQWLGFSERVRGRGVFREFDGKERPLVLLENERLLLSVGQFRRRRLLYERSLPFGLRQLFRWLVFGPRLALGR